LRVGLVIRLRVWHRSRIPRSVIASRPCGVATQKAPQLKTLIDNAAEANKSANATAFKEGNVAL